MLKSTSCKVKSVFTLVNIIKKNIKVMPVKNLISAQKYNNKVSVKTDSVHTECLQFNTSNLLNTVRYVRKYFSTIKKDEEREHAILL